MATFPALIPSSRTFTPGEYAATAFAGYSGNQNRVRHSNVFIDAQLRLSFIGLSESDMLSIWTHYAGQRGAFEPFPLPAQIVSNDDLVDYVPGNYTWKYSAEGFVEDLPCGGHNVTLTLVTAQALQGVASGANLFLRVDLAAGAAAAGAFAAGISESITLSLSAGAATTSLNGLLATITLSLAPGAAIGDVSVNGADLGMALTLTAGVVIEDLEPQIGDAYGGGYFAGYISHNADGIATHRLIVAPAATGASGTGYTITTNLQWKTTATETANTESRFDGAANTAAMVAAGINDHPGAKFCTELTIGNYSDWYLPATDELEIAYYNLKPTTASNDTSNATRNAYSVPSRSSTNYTASVPAQTTVAAFQLGGSEAFSINSLWSSTQNSGAFTKGQAWLHPFNNGARNAGNLKTTAIRVRAFRREAI